MNTNPLRANNLMRNLALLAILLPLCGCRVTQQQIERRHWDLNDSIRRTHTEQLLLNIVRLRYDDTPYFLQVSSVSSQFSAGQSANVSGTIPDGGASVLGLGASISYSESPVVTWSLPDSREFLGRMMAPMGADQLTVLAQSGYDPQRVLQAGIKKINSLRNMDFTVAQGLVVPDTYAQFIEVLRLIQELRKDGLVDLAYGVMSSMGAGKIPMERLDTRAIPEGLQYGLQFMTRDDPHTFEPLKLSKPLFLRFSKASEDDPRAQRVRELLNLTTVRTLNGPKTG
ncbi:MAG: hypothetical protein H6827_00225 [Planctomycetes bacterium]|nr:hypothetical protein [Planctomycetota bacterium]